MVDKVNIYVISHLEEEIKKTITDDIHIPLFVGRNGRNNYGFLSDDIGDEISSRNSYYCELTGLYWIWKNTNEDIIGLCHYRRYFKNDNGKIIKKENIIEYLNDYDIILPKKNRLVKSNYWETYENHYSYDAWCVTREVISELFPEYLKTFDEILNQDSFHNYNMFIADKKLIDSYCSWIFPILSEVENRLDMEKYPRVLGLISEAIFNVWVKYNKLNVKECKIFYLEYSLRLRMWASQNNIIRNLYYLFKKIT